MDLSDAINAGVNREMPPPIPGMRPPLGSPGGPVPAPKSSMGFVMPIYTICIIVFFVYTLSKILFRRTASPYDPVAPDPQFRRRVFRDDSRSSPDKLGKKEADTIVTAISGLVAEVQQQMEASYAQNQQRQDVQDNARPYTNGTILLNTGPVQIVTSEYKDAKEKTPEPVNEKEATPEPNEAEPTKVASEPLEPDVVAPEPAVEPKESSPDIREPSPEPALTLEQKETALETVVLIESTPVLPQTQENNQPLPEPTIPEPEVVIEPSPETIEQPIETSDEVVEESITNDSVLTSAVSELKELIVERLVTEAIPEVDQAAQESSAPGYSSDTVQILDPKHSLSDLEATISDFTETIVQSKEPILELKETILESNIPIPEIEKPVPVAVKPTSEPKDPSPVLEESISEPNEPTPEPTEFSPERKVITSETNEPIPETKISSPTSEHPTPATEKLIPDLNKPDTIASESIPEPKESSPIPIEPVSALEEAIPELSGPATKPKEPTPEPKEPTPVPKEPTPEPKEPTAVPQEPTPEPKEPTPVSNEPTPEPKEPIPEPEEPTPQPTPETKDADECELRDSSPDSKQSSPECDLGISESKETTPDTKETSPDIKEPIPESIESIPELPTLKHPSSELIEPSQELDAPVVNRSPEPSVNTSGLKEPTPQSKEPTPEPKLTAEPESIQTNQVEDSPIPEGTLIDLNEAIAEEKTQKEDEEEIANLKEDDIRLGDIKNDADRDASEELIKVFAGTDQKDDSETKATENLLKEQRFVLVQSTPNVAEENNKAGSHKASDSEEEEVENAAVKVVGMESTAHPADGGAWPRDLRPARPAPAAPAPHEAEEVKSIFLETEIPQQSRVLVAQFAEDREESSEKPRPAKHAPLVVSGKMTLSLIQDAPRETPERDPESTLDDFTTASALTQPAAEKGELESDEEVDEEIEVEEIEEEYEEDEEDEEPAPVKAVKK